MYRHRITSPVTLKISGDPHKVTAFINFLNKALGDHQLADLCIEPYAHGRKDGLREQTAYLDIEPQRYYATKAEKPFEDKSGEIYLLQSLETNGRYKLGESIHPRQRLQEVQDSYGERFRIIAIQYVSTDRFARETWLRKWLVEQGAKRLEREVFQMTDKQVERFIALGNE